MEESFGEEKYETPERSRLPAWSQYMDGNSTVKKEGMIAEENERSTFKTPTKKPTLPTMAELERWDRINRERLRKRR